MAKLLPPVIESKLPAQVGDTLSIPFLHNRSVSLSQYTGIQLIIKTISTNIEVANLTGDKNAIFNINPSILTVGQYYKAQIAYIGLDGEIGYYSTIGVFKYTNNPTLSISSNSQDFVADGKNYVGFDLLGKYEAPIIKENEYDNEKVYSYQFNIYENEKLFDSTGELIHNSSNDKDPNSSIDKYTFTKILNPLANYFVEYTVTTSNGLIVSTPRYAIEQGALVPNSFNFSARAESDYETGGVKIFMDFDNGSNLIQGYFRLVRFHNDSQQLIKEFTINNIVSGEKLLGTDYTVQQGMEYKYGIQQYSGQLSTEYAMTNTVKVDFEDAFLFDGERQLKIKFNPKVTSFKTTILESKLDTIGGQFPFVFRNGRTNYKEFPISGLISYWMDNEELFMSDEELRLTAQPVRNSDHYRMTNLTGDNIASERIFKLAVLDWLNNGKPKLFRSPTEGNYIVRLMNVSLSPDDTLGRMLHTFNCTAYEIAENTFDSLTDNGFAFYFNNNGNLWRFFSINEEELLEGQAVNINSAHWMRLYGNPKSLYLINFDNSKSVTIQIGFTGQYEISGIDNKITSIMLKEKIVEEPNIFEHKIEYSTMAIENSNLTHNGQIISSIRTEEKAAQRMGEIDLLATICPTNSNIALDNILFLRLQYKGTAGTSTVNIDDKEIKLGVSSSGSATIYSFIELTAEDFDGKFIPNKLIIGENIQADIYYKVKIINGG